MSLSTRLKVSAVLVVIVVGVLVVLVVLDIVVGLNLGSVLFSPWFVLPVFAFAFILAPLVVTYVPYIRKKTE